MWSARWHHAIIPSPADVCSARDRVPAFVSPSPFAQWGLDGWRTCDFLLLFSHFFILASRHRRRAHALMESFDELYAETRAPGRRLRISVVTQLFFNFIFFYTGSLKRGQKKISIFMILIHLKLFYTTSSNNIRSCNTIRVMIFWFFARLTQSYLLTIYIYMKAN